MFYSKNLLFHCFKNSTIFQSQTIKNLDCKTLTSKLQFKPKQSCNFFKHNICQTHLFKNSTSYRFYRGSSGPGDPGSPRYGYSKADEVIENMSRTEIIRNSIKIMKEELQLWKQEIKEHFESDPILIHRPGEIDILFRFDNDKDRNSWILSADSDHKEGFSQCSLTPSPYGTALFSGSISTQVPKDGRTKKAGYCNMTSMRKRKSFKREDTYDWNGYTHLVFRVRGDGRSYLLNLQCPGDYDVLWSDMYHYVLYTRGGPYWQFTKIPFSKFFLGARGRVQDIQSAIPLNRVMNLGITTGDGNEGPFSLEIDYIGLEYDPNHSEEFAYEMYQMERFIVKS